jgi:hypothetical protein
MAVLLWRVTQCIAAQLGARLNGIQEVTSSILVRSTNSTRVRVECVGRLVLHDLVQLVIVG